MLPLGSTPIEGSSPRAVSENTRCYPSAISVGVARSSAERGRQWTRERVLGAMIAAGRRALVFGVTVPNAASA